MEAINFRSASLLSKVSSRHVEQSYLAAGNGTIKSRMIHPKIYEIHFVHLEHCSLYCQMALISNLGTSHISEVYNDNLLKYCLWKYEV